MINWNGNGKVDPVDVGITMAILDDAEKEKTGCPKRSGCLTAILTLFIFAALIVLVVFVIL